MMDTEEDAEPCGPQVGNLLFESLVLLSAESDNLEIRQMVVPSIANSGS